MSPEHTTNIKCALSKGDLFNMFLLANTHAPHILPVHFLWILPLLEVIFVYQTLKQTTF